MTEDFDKKLEALRKRFIENFPQNDLDKESEIAAFLALPLEEKLKKVATKLEILDEKESLLKEKLSITASEAEKSEIAEHLKAIAAKQDLLKTKLELLKSSGTDTVKKEKLKRQLTQLEIKRCKSRLEKKDCHKIDAKIAHKKEIFKKVFG
ncbi:MAG: hypothetical protein LBI13_10600 [Streptococcaceae bacterium]|jgi:hypothetical protein|nr:hypothetical protein [Streptococcaceae bacterium]